MIVAKAIGTNLQYFWEKIYSNLQTTKDEICQKSIMLNWCKIKGISGKK